VIGARSYAKFATLRGALRVWAISAIHGEARRLMRVHDAIGERFREGDRVVYLGNYLGRGADILATVDEMLDFRRRLMARRRGLACDLAVLRGAQEEMWHKLLQLQFAPNPGEVLDWLARAGAEATIRAYGGDLRRGFAAAREGARAITRWTGALRAAMNAAPGHTMLFSALRHAAFTEDKGLLFVHAGIDPARPLSEQRDAFWWGGADPLELTAPFDGFGRVVCGSDRACRGLVEREFAAVLDGGAGRGGPVRGASFSAGGGVVDRLEA
jgi:serine/threonine protein phosphatase 1